MKGNCENLVSQIEQTAQEIHNELHWFKNDNFAGHLFGEIKENCANLEREMTEINQSLEKIDGTLDGLLKETAPR